MHNIFNINLIKFGKSDVNGEKCFFSSNLGWSVVFSNLKISKWQWPKSEVVLPNNIYKVYFYYFFKYWDYIFVKEIHLHNIYIYIYIYFFFFKINPHDK